MKDAFIKLAAAIIYADGDASAEEMKSLGEYAPKLGLESDALIQSVIAEVETLKPFDEDEYQAYLETAAKTVLEEEFRYWLFDAMLQLTLEDGVLDDMETHVLGLIAQYLQIPTYYFANNLAYHVKKNGVEISAQLKWEKQEEVQLG